MEVGTYCSAVQHATAGPWRHTIALEHPQALCIMDQRSICNAAATF